MHAELQGFEYSGLEKGGAPTARSSYVAYDRLKTDKDLGQALCTKPNVVLQRPSLPCLIAHA